MDCSWPAAIRPPGRRCRDVRLASQAVEPLVVLIHPLSAGSMPLTMVEGGGFEPPKAEPSDLQSDPFGHSGTPPKIEPAILQNPLGDCQGAEPESATLYGFLPGMTKLNFIFFSGSPDYGHRTWVSR